MYMYSMYISDKDKHFAYTNAYTSMSLCRHTIWYVMCS